MGKLLPRGGGRYNESGWLTEAKTGRLNEANETSLPTSVNNSVSIVLPAGVWLSFTLALTTLSEQQRPFFSFLPQQSFSVSSEKQISLNLPPQ